MKILVVLGSPRKNGNSETLAATVTTLIQKLIPAEVEFLRLHKANISGCVGCNSCEKTGQCIMKDDMESLYEKVDEADIIFLATPIYFYGPSAQIKTFIDRFQARWSRKYMLKTRFRQGEKRYGYLLSTAATHGKKLFDGPILIAKSYFDAIDVAYGGSFVVRGVDEKGAFAEKADEVSAAEAFARTVVQQIKEDTLQDSPQV